MSRLPDGTPTADLPCRFCGHLGRDHQRGYCFGSLNSIPPVVELSKAVAENLRRGVDVRGLQLTPVPPACDKYCRAYCAPGGIEILS